MPHPEQLARVMHRTQAPMSIPAAKNSSPAPIGVALDRLLVADLDESLALDAAALVVQDSEGRRHLRHQALRRRIFQDNLAKAIVALGGVQARRGSYRAQARSLTRRISQFFAGGHGGDAYAACARAAGNTQDAYARALRSALPAEVRLDIERELSEIGADHMELVRLRFGEGSPLLLARHDVGVRYRLGRPEHQDACNCAAMGA